MNKIATLAVMAIFYIAYFAKQIAQRRQGVSTMILGKGDKPGAPVFRRRRRLRS